MKLSRGASLFLLAFGAWSWVIWVTLMVNVAKDPRAFSAAGSPTGFLIVHWVLAVISLALGTAIAVLGLRGLSALRREKAE
ncbi:membrane protein [Kutzneria viridogrisea]|uniref:Uncharacterized protein n=2 Tax=Kutzneria TaxID=43356 RepID=W5WTB8_9PSEU|nr:hypothetical protein [Kutzneria albida]AHI01400.1 hypothetical protein KALB_8042 [Kutzneria albida DSM 43870]MBA8931359.1 hypothetical protein [Kutzneria viridogrisea]